MSPRKKDRKKRIKGGCELEGPTLDSFSDDRSTARERIERDQKADKEERINPNPMGPQKDDNDHKQKTVESGSAHLTSISRSDIIESIARPTKTHFQLPDRDITVKEAQRFLKAFKTQIEKRGSVGIYFHTDMDGLNGALFVKDLIQHWFGMDYRFLASPIDHNELQLLKLDEEICYIFVDIAYPGEAKNVFTVDHHDPKRDLKLVSDRRFILTPAEKDYEYPSTAAGLCGYLNYVGKGGDLSFVDYLNRGDWQDKPFERLLILLASVCDNLWHLNFLVDIPIKRWIPDPEEERYLILVSISSSLMLGEKEKRDMIVERFFKERVSPEGFLDLMCTYLVHASNILDFVEQLSNVSENFYNDIFFSLTESIESTLAAWERDREMYGKLEGSMPIDLRGNREKMKELQKTRGDETTEHWKRINFYIKELDRLESKIKVEEKTLQQLRAAKKIISVETGPRLCVILPKQHSVQIKGIVASLLYFKGWKNVVIEERKGEATWGARGFTRAQIEEQFNTLSLGYEELKDYLFLEKVFKELPDVFRKTLNISKKVLFNKTYSGGMGGRGLIFGGTLTGKVPWIFTILEESGDVESKIKELMKHKELGSALQGLTEGTSSVSTSQALRSKLKSTGWLVIQIPGGKEDPEVMFGNINKVILNLVGHGKRADIQLREIPKPLPNMETGVFDGLVD